MKTFDEDGEHLAKSNTLIKIMITILKNIFSSKKHFWKSIFEVKYLIFKLDDEEHDTISKLNEKNLLRQFNVSLKEQKFNEQSFNGFNNAFSFFNIR